MASSDFEPHIELVSLTALQPWAKNARLHSKKQLKQLSASIKEFGFTAPVLIDGENTILAGHGRVEAAKLADLKKVPCIRLDHLSPAQKRAYALADNKIALNATWDEHLLAEELKSLSEIDASFDLDITGFSFAEVDSLVEGLNLEEPNDPNDDRLPPDDSIRRCRPGDLWRLGPHRLLCGNALDHAAIAVLMANEKARMAFTDPPYNVPIEGNVGGAGAIKHREFAMASGEMSGAEFTGFLEAAFRNLVTFSIDGSIHFVCMDWRHMTNILDAGRTTFTELKNLIVWGKNNGGLGTFYRSRHELIFAFKRGTAPHLNTFELGQHGRNRTNLWEYNGVNTFRAGRMDELALHPTVKPVQMIADAIKDVSGRGDIVLDLFGGSGSTLIAAHKTGRRGYLCEIDTIYCDRIIQRWETYACDEAELIAAGTGIARVEPADNGGCRNDIR
jgi:DNA modification methylase